MRTVLIIVLIVLVVVLLVGGFLYFKSYKQDKDFTKAVALFRSGLYSQAAMSFAKFVADYPDSDKTAMAYGYLALASFYSGNKVGAINSYNTACSKFAHLVRKSPDSDVTVETLVLLGKVVRVLGIPSEQLLDASKFIYNYAVNNPNKDKILTQIGYLKLFEGKLDDAMSYFSRADTELAELGKARVYIRKGDYPSAFAIYESFLKYRQDSPYIWDIKKAFAKQLNWYAHHLFYSKDYVEADKYFSKMYRYFRGTKLEDEALFGKGEVRYALGKLWRALKFYNSVLANAVSYRDKDALFKKGLCYYELGKKEKAVKIFQHFIDVYPNSRLASRAKEWLEIIKRELASDFNDF